MTALAHITASQAGTFLMLLGIYAYGVQQVAHALTGHRTSAGAFTAVALCLLIGALCFVGSWVL